MEKAGCMVPGCGRISRSLGLCSAHDIQFRKYGRITHVHIHPRNTPPQSCKVCGKQAKYVATQLCNTCYERERRKLRQQGVGAGAVESGVN